MRRRSAHAPGLCRLSVHRQRLPWNGAPNDSVLHMAPPRRLPARAGNLPRNLAMLDSTRLSDETVVERGEGFGDTADRLGLVVAGRCGLSGEP